MNGAPARQHDDVQALVEAYRGDLIAVGMFAQKPVTSTARSFLLEIGVEGWGALSLAEQCALPPKYRRVVSWLIVTGRVRPTPDYLVVCRPHVGEVAAHLQPAFHERFKATSADLGFGPVVSRLQWSALVRVGALSGVRPEQLSTAAIRDGHAALHAALGRHHPTVMPRGAVQCAVRARPPVPHWRLDEPPRKLNPSLRCTPRVASVPPLLAARYRIHRPTSCRCARHDVRVTRAA